METSSLLSSIEQQSVTTPNLRNVKIRVKEIIDYSTNLLDRKSSVIQRELESLKREYLTQLSKLNEYFAQEKPLQISKSPIKTNRISANRTYKPKLITKTSIPNSPNNKTNLNKNSSSKNITPNESTKKSSTQVNRDSSSNSLLNNKSFIPKRNTTASDSSNSMISISTNNNTVKRRPSPLNPLNEAINNVVNENIMQTKVKTSFIKHARTKSLKDDSLNNDKKVIGKKAMVEFIQNNNPKENSQKKKIKTSPVVERRDVKDERKFSILDIAASALEFAQENEKEKLEIKNDYTFIKSKGIRNSKAMALYVLATHQ